jgi:hypothetical protein
MLEAFCISTHRQQAALGRSLMPNIGHLRLLISHPSQQKSTSELRAATAKRKYWRLEKKKLSSTPSLSPISPPCEKSSDLPRAGGAIP